MPGSHRGRFRTPPDGINPGCLSRGEKLVSWLGLGFVVALLAWPLVALLWRGSAVLLVWFFGPAAAMGLATIVAAPVAYRLSRREIVAADYCLCMKCRYPLGTLPPEGTCPECGAQYEHEQLRKCWKWTLDEHWRA